MILSFHDPTTAALFAAWKRSEGYYAEVLDEHVCHLYGPLPTGGARVIFSTAEVADAEPPPVICWSRFLMPALRVGVLAAVLGGLLSLLAIFLNASQQPRGYEPSLDIGALLSLPVAAVGCYLVSRLMILFTHRDRMRQAGEAMHPIWAALVIAYCTWPVSSTFIVILYFIGPG